MLAMTVLGLVAAFYTVGGDNFVGLSWDQSGNPPIARYVVYRGRGPCSTAILSERIRSISVKAYADHSISTGTYCYAAAAIVDGEEAEMSARVQVIVPVL